MHKLFSAALIGVTVATAYAAIPSEWKDLQKLKVEKAGLVRVPVPQELLAGAQPSLADVRLFDPNGEELAYLVSRHEGAGERWQALGTLTVAMDGGRTVASGLVPVGEKPGVIDAVELQSPAPEFLKGVSVDGSRDNLRWTTLVVNRPIFRQPDGAQSLVINLPPSTWTYLRVRLDDRMTPPIPLSAIQARFRPEVPLDFRFVSPEVLERASDNKQTTLRLRLPDANIYVHEVVLELSDAFFRRRVSVLRRDIENGVFLEIPVSESTIYRLSLDGRDLVENVRVPIRAVVPGQEIVLRIFNGENRPLNIADVDVASLPTLLTFYAVEPGVYTVAAGNPLARAKSFDLSYFRKEMEQGSFQTGLWGAMEANPGYRAPEALPLVGDEGAPIDVSRWPYRKAVQLQNAFVHRLELDPETVARLGGSTERLRLVREDRQVPYVMDAPVARLIPLTLEPHQSDARTTRWRLRLPVRPFPAHRLRIASPEPLFDRTIRVLEKRQDERGTADRTILGETTWRRTPEGEVLDLSLPLLQTPQEQELYLEVLNGDNPPIQISRVEAEYRAPVLVFKSEATNNLWLYYGFPKAARPEYDLSAVAGELISTKTAAARLGAEEVLQVEPWWQAPRLEGVTKYIFWGILIAVVLVLLGVIARLLKEEEGVTTEQ